ncbi:hypothetical protein J7L68_00975 [bacterium]|nr:hypothetical protein [bacterium]
MQDFSENRVNCPQWLCCDTPNSDIILGGEVLFIRNIENTPFPVALSDDKKKEIGEIFTEELVPYFENHSLLNKFEISDRYYYWERFLIPYSSILRPEYAHLLFDSDEMFSAVIDGSDHFTLRCLISDIDFGSALEEAESVIERMDEKYHWATHSQFGYLSSNPARCGTGVILSAFCHIAGTLIANRFEQVRDIAKSHGLGINALWRQGVDSGSSFVKIYTKQLVGKSVEQIQNDITIAIDSIIQIERDSREYLMTESEIFIKDKVNRAYGIISFANLIERMEFQTLLSSLRLGAFMSILPISAHTIDELLILGQQAHIAKEYNEIESPLDLAIMRAKLAREKLGIF